MEGLEVWRFWTSEHNDCWGRERGVRGREQGRGGGIGRRAIVEGVGRGPGMAAMDTPSPTPLLPSSAVVAAAAAPAMGQPPSPALSSAEALSAQGLAKGGNSNGGAKGRQGSGVAGQLKGAWSQVVRGQVSAESQAPGTANGPSSTANDASSNPATLSNSDTPVAGKRVSQGQAMQSHPEQLSAAASAPPTSSPAAPGSMRKKQQEVVQPEAEKQLEAVKQVEPVISKGESEERAGAVPATAGSIAVPPSDEPAKPAKPAWKKPSSSVGKVPAVGPVMDAVSWPALGDTRSFKPPSELSPKPAVPAAPSDTPVSQQVGFYVALFALRSGFWRCGAWNVWNGYMSTGVPCVIAIYPPS